MPSPFPGMNPYLEGAAAGTDFHNSFIPYAREALTAQVLPRYFVKIEEHLFIHEPSAAERFAVGHSDIAIGPTHGAIPSGNVGVVPSVAPATVGMPAEIEMVRIPYLEIRDRESRQVVTVLELLSPANKYTGADRDAYFNKMQKLLRTNTHVVEIDLLRGGPRMPWQSLPACDYYALVSRYPDRMRDGARADVWPVRLRDPLPVIPIPLRPGEPEATLDIQAVLHRVYDTAGYALYIYDGPPEPRLAPADAAWADGVLNPPTSTP